MPNPDQAMPLGANDHRRLLPADRPPVQRRKVVRRRLQRVQEVVEVLDVADRPQPAHGGADRLAEDRRLADPGVRQPQLSVLCLQSLEHEVDVAQPADVLADDEDAWIAREVGVEVADEHLPAVDRRRLV